MTYILICLDSAERRDRLQPDRRSGAQYDVRPLLGADMPEVARLRGAKVEKANVLIGDAT